MVITISSIQKELKRLSDPVVKQSAQRFHKDEIKTYGIKTPVIQSLAKEYYGEIKHWYKAKTFSFCDQLLQSGMHEEAMLAFEWIYALRKQFAPADFKQFERWIKNDIHNWATCDTFCNNSMGAFLMFYPDHLPQLKKWAVAKNRWLQRAAAVSLIAPARKGLFLKEAFAIANLQMDSGDDLVQKGYGWLLKVYSKKFPDEVYHFVKQRRSTMPRTALRYAIEHFCTEWKAELMGK